MSEKKINWFLLIILLSVFEFPLKAQTEDSLLTANQKAVSVFGKEKRTIYDLESFGVKASGDRNPFWMRSQTYGLVPFNHNSLIFKAGVFHEQRFSKELSGSLGLGLVDVVDNRTTSRFWIQQIYAGAQWKFLAVQVGSREQHSSELTDSELSSGDLVYSDNVRPNPEFKIYLPEFVAVPFTGRKLFVKADLAFGKYLDGDYVKNIGLNLQESFVENPNSHHKSLYLRLGDIRWKQEGFQYTIGVNDYAQWGGKTYLYASDTNTGTQTLSNPSSSSGNILKVLVPYDPLNSGAHLGSYNLKVDYGRAYGDEVFSFYAQHLINSRDDLRFQNFRDVMLGLSYRTTRRKKITGFVLEYIYTKNQGGDGASYRSNYYNKAIFGQGNSYYGRGMGNPLLMSPENNASDVLSFLSNRVEAVHLGIDGFFSRQWKYKFLCTYGNSDGTYSKPYEKEESGITSYLELSYRFPKIEGLSVQGSVAAEKGAFFIDQQSNNFGFGLSIRKTGKLF